MCFCAGRQNLKRRWEQNGDWHFKTVWPCIVIGSLWIKPTDALSSSFIGVTTLHVSGSLSAHHQEFLAVHRHWYNLCSLVAGCYQAQDGTARRILYLSSSFYITVALLEDGRNYRPKRVVSVMSKWIWNHLWRWIEREEINKYSFKICFEQILSSLSPCVGPALDPNVGL